MLFSKPSKTATQIVLAWRRHLNRLPPCVVLAADFLPDRIETHVFLEKVEPDSIRLALNQDGRPVTAANIAAALGPRDVANAAACLVDAAAGRKEYAPVSLCAYLSATLFGQVDRYPLDRFDYRSPIDCGPS